MSAEPHGDQPLYAAEHIASPVSYVVVWVVLLGLTVATTALGFVRMDGWNTVVSLLIAAIKAGLVAAFFMHLVHTEHVTLLVAGAGLLWFAILLGLVLADVLTRNEIA